MYLWRYGANTHTHTHRMNYVQTLAGLLRVPSKTVAQPKNMKLNNPDNGYFDDRHSSSSKITEKETTFSISSYDWSSESWREWLFRFQQLDEFHELDDQILFFLLKSELSARVESDNRTGDSVLLL